MIPTDIFDYFLMKYFEFKEATSYSPHLQNWPGLNFSKTDLTDLLTVWPFVVVV